MDSAHPIDVDNDSELTSLHTRDTPTLDDGEHPSIKALTAAQEAHDDAEFNLIVARMPSDHRLMINGLNLATPFYQAQQLRPRKGIAHPLDRRSNLPQSR
jgi:hypothetical protein